MDSPRMEVRTVYLGSCIAFSESRAVATFNEEYRIRKERHENREKLQRNAFRSCEKSWDQRISTFSNTIFGWRRVSRQVSSSKPRTLFRSTSKRGVLL